MISVDKVCKNFKVPVRPEGIGAAFKSLVKREYKTVQALDNVSFDIARGETVGYIGPNGAGKSTTVKILSGILRPDSGKCVINGKVPYDQRQSHVADIGVVFGQRSQLWWDVPVIDSFELIRDIYSLDDKKYKSNLSLMTETLGLSEFLNTPARQLSLGMRMRCELAASLLHGPKLLFLDEPTIGLDAISKLAVRKFIKTVNREKNVTVILTTHDMNDIEALASRVILIGRGKILYDGGFANLKDNFSPIKLVTVSYSSDNGAALPPFYELQSSGNGIAIFSADSAVTINEVLSDMSIRFDIQDISLKDEAVENIVARVYEELSI